MIEGQTLYNIKVIHKLSLREKIKEKRLENTIRILITDDNPEFRDQVKKLIIHEADMEVISEAVNGRETIMKAHDYKPDIVLMDIRIPEMNGLEVTKWLRSEMPQIIIILFTIYETGEYREMAIANGANGFVVKKNILSELISTIRHVINRNCYSKSNAMESH